MAPDEIDYLSMSDEDIANTMPPSAAPVEQDPPVDDDLPAVDDEPAQDPPNQPEGSVEEAEGGDGDKPEDGNVVEPPGAPAPKEGGNEVPDGGVDTDKPKDPSKEPEGGDKANTSEPKNETPAKFESTPENHKALYDLVLGKPIKANGKEIQLDSPEEVLKLVQMGANYTKKMQQLHPSLRFVKMLDNNGLLDEQKLSRLIDLDKGNPQAIQSFLAEKKFDPNTFDEEQAASYTPGNHQVSDAELRFSQALDDVRSTPHGSELVEYVAKQWDQESKNALYEDPSILTTISDHKGLGLYDQITGEMERQRIIGNLPHGTPWLQAYRATGEMLAKTGRLGNQPKPEPAPLETRIVAPPLKVDNDDKARAAAATKGNPNPRPSQTNYLDMSDDEFEREMAKKL